MINFYFKLINDNNPRVYCFSTFFYTKLSLKWTAAVKDWAKDVSRFLQRNLDAVAHGLTLSFCITYLLMFYSQVNWDECELVLVPIHLPGHWTLAIMDLKNHSLRLYDSLGFCHPGIPKVNSFFCLKNMCSMYF